jgi:hypothetical protein
MEVGQAEEEAAQAEQDKLVVETIKLEQVV